MVEQRMRVLRQSEAASRRLRYVKKKSELVEKVMFKTENRLVEIKDKVATIENEMNMRIEEQMIRNAG